MNNLKKIISTIVLFAVIFPWLPVLAKETSDPFESIFTTNQNHDGINPAMIGRFSANEINSANSAKFKMTAIKGSLIEIGNTTAEETTLVIRVTEKGTTTDLTIEVPTKIASLNNNSGAKADMSDWIAGDQLVVMAKKDENSGHLIAQSIRNLSFKAEHKGVNGWIKTIDASKNLITVEWGNNIYTVSLAGAKIVAGAKNPAAIADLKVQDRVRLRVIDDRDKNPATWKAQMLVVLRRDKDNFMRVTRAVFPAKIVSIPTDLSLPTTIEVEVLPSKFFQKGDANDIVGASGTKIYLDISSSTQLFRRFLGKSLLSEFSVGDELQITGRRDEATGHISAQMIQNNSIQMLGMAQRTGIVTAVDPSAKTISIKVLPAVKGEETVTIIVTTATKIFIDGQEKTLADVALGDIVKAKGVYNRNARSVDAKTIGITSKEKTRNIKEKAVDLKNKFKNAFKKVKKD